MEDPNTENGSARFKPLSRLDEEEELDVDPRRPAAWLLLPPPPLPLLLR